MDISLVNTTVDGKDACLAVLAMVPGLDIPGARILGSIDDVHEGGPQWTSFRRNTRFAEVYVRYMRGEWRAAPQILQDARVKPGEYVYIIDQRTPTPKGRVPWTDIVGWYESDETGAPRAETFTYNKDHELVTKDGAWSGVLEDEALTTMLGENS